VILLDTNVLSEVLKPLPSGLVFALALAAQEPSVIFTTTITQAEILYGIEVLAAWQAAAPVCWLPSRRCSPKSFRTEFYLSMWDCCA